MSNKRFQFGFTLIELIICIAIFVIIATIVLVNFRLGGSRSELRAQAQNLASVLRKAQNMAKSGSVWQCPEKTGVPDQGYGVILHDTGDKYILFANCKDLPYSSSDDREVETVNLPSGVKIEIDYTFPLVFVFIPPEAVPIEILNGNNPDSLSGDVPITLRLENTTYERYVVVNADTGRIEIKTEIEYAPIE